MIIEGDLIRDSEGQFSIEFSQSDRNKLIYKEADKKTIAFIEQSYDMVSVNKGSIVRWAEPHSDELIDELERDKILGNIEKAILATDCKFELY